MIEYRKANIEYAALHLDNSGLVSNEDLVADLIGNISHLLEEMNDIILEKISQHTIGYEDSSIAQICQTIQTLTMHEPNLLEAKYIQIKESELESNRQKIRTIMMLLSIAPSDNSYEKGEQETNNYSSLQLTVDFQEDNKEIACVGILSNIGGRISKMVLTIVNPQQKPFEEYFATSDYQYLRNIGKIKDTENIIVTYNDNYPGYRKIKVHHFIETLEVNGEKRMLYVAFS